MGIDKGKKSDLNQSKNENDVIRKKGKTQKINSNAVNEQKKNTYGVYIHNEESLYNFNLMKDESNCIEMQRIEYNNAWQYECYNDFGVTEDKEKFLNPEEWELNGIDTSIENNVYPNFPLGPDSLKSILDNFMKKETIWDISYHDNLNDSSGKSFNPFPFSESHNQHFIFQKGKIFIKHNGVLESIVGGENSLKKFNYQPKLKSLQPFKTRLI